MGAFDYSSQADMLRTINHVSIFSGIGIHEQHMLADKCTILHRERDEIIIEQGEVADRLYMIIKGSVLISKRTVLNEWVHVNTLGPGDVFGEIAILRSYPRTARVTTATPCTFLTVSAQDFLHIYQYFPANSRDNIQGVIAKRLAGLPV
jgi:CRP/FNR family cyclic AMP-dependent transcriptional regulator